MTQYFGKTHETFTTTTVAPQAFAVNDDVDDKVLKFGGNKFVALKNKDGLLSIYTNNTLAGSKAALRPVYFYLNTVTTTVGPTSAAEHYNLGSTTTKGTSQTSKVYKPSGMSDDNLSKLKTELKKLTGLEATFTSEDVLKLGDKEVYTCENDDVCGADSLLQRGEYQSNMMLMIIIGVCVLLLIILIVILSSKKKRFNYTSPYRFSYPSYAYQSYY